MTPSFSLGDWAHYEQGVVGPHATKARPNRRSHKSGLMKELREKSLEIMLTGAGSPKNPGMHCARRMIDYPDDMLMLILRRKQRT